MNTSTSDNYRDSASGRIFHYVATDASMALAADASAMESDAMAAHYDAKAESDPRYAVVASNYRANAEYWRGQAREYRAGGLRRSRLAQGLVPVAPSACACFHGEACAPV